MNEPDPTDLLAVMESVAAAPASSAQQHVSIMPCGECGAQVPLYQLKAFSDRRLCLNCYSAANLRRNAATPVRPRMPGAKAEKPPQKFVTVPGLIMLVGMAICGFAALVVTRNQDTEHIASEQRADAQQQQRRSEEQQRSAAMKETEADNNRPRVVTGTVWLKLGNGETMSVALADVLVLPLQIDAGNREIRELPKRALDGIHVQQDMDARMAKRPNQSFELMSYLAKGGPGLVAARQRLDELIKADPVDTVAACEQLLLEQELSVEGQASLNVITERRIYTPEKDHREQQFFKRLRTLAMDSAQTNRDGKFSVTEKPGKYALVCRAQIDNKIVYWCAPADTASSREIEMNNSSATVLDYR